MDTAISIKVVHEQSGKVEYERERLLGIANKLMNFQSGSQLWGMVHSIGDFSPPGKCDGMNDMQKT